MMRREAPDLAILFRDEHFVAIDKPRGLLVHRTAQARDRTFALQRLRDQLGQRVYAIHRLDRATSGVLVFALHPEAARRLSRRFETRRVSKRYLAVVRGYTQARALIDYPLVDQTPGAARRALTGYRRLAQVEVPVAVTRYPSSRYSLLEVAPWTGRRHQIRRHCHHIHHPVIGDTTHGEGRHNRYFRDRFEVQRLWLMARSLGFDHPFGGRYLEITAPLDADWRRLLAAFGWQAALDLAGSEGPEGLRDFAPVPVPGWRDPWA